jgi:sterol desaturase/sphingolipid hydroxylase (fatty acid hydroxylase superfamily)
MTGVDPGGSASQRWWERLAHSTPVLLAAMGLCGLHPDGVVVSTVLFVLAYAGLTWHGRNLCLRCADRVSRMPDPAAVAERNLWSLRQLHRLITTAGTVTVVGVLLASSALTALVPEAAWLRTPRALVLCVALGLTARAIFLHCQVMPWCPYCRRGGGGEDDPVPDPVPVPTGEGTR